MNLSSLDLNLLWAFHVVLTERSVSRAAARLHVTPPAVSNALARLREALGDPLFVRRGRGLVPTPRALELGPVLAASFGAMEASLRGGRFEPATCTRTLTLALSDADQIASLGALTRAFVERLPAARLRIVSLDVLVSSGGLASDEIDATIGPAFEGEGLHRTFLYEEEGVHVVRAEHPRIARRITPAQFGAEGHVDIHLLLGRAGEGNRAVASAIERAGLQRRVVAIAPSFVAAASMVAATELVTGLPRRVAERLAPSFGLQILRGPTEPFRFQLYLHWHERTNHDPAAAAFRAAIVAATSRRASRRR